MADAGPEPEPQLVRPAERKVELLHRIGDVTGVQVSTSERVSAA